MASMAAGYPEISFGPRMVTASVPERATSDSYAAYPGAITAELGKGSVITLTSSYPSGL